MRSRRLLADITAFVVVALLLWFLWGKMGFAFVPYTALHRDR